MQCDVDLGFAGLLSLSGSVGFEQSAKTVTLGQASDEVQVLEVSSGLRGGSWYRLQMTVGGLTVATRDLHLSEDNAAIEGALNAALIPVDGARVQVTTAPGTDKPMIRFAGALAGTDVASIAVVRSTYGVAASAQGSVTTAIDGGVF